VSVHHACHLYHTPYDGILFVRVHTRSFRNMFSPAKRKRNWRVWRRSNWSKRSSHCSVMRCSLCWCHRVPVYLKIYIGHHAGIVFTVWLPAWYLFLYATCSCLSSLLSRLVLISWSFGNIMCTHIYICMYILCSCECVNKEMYYMYMYIYSYSYTFVYTYYVCILICIYT